MHRVLAVAGLLLAVVTIAVLGGLPALAAGDVPTEQRAPADEADSNAVDAGPTADVGVATRDGVERGAASSVASAAPSTASGAPSTSPFSTSSTGGSATDSTVPSAIGSTAPSTAGSTSALATTGLSSGSGPAPTAATTTDASDDAIVETATYRQLPDTNGRVAVQLRYTIPSSVESLSFGIVAGEYDVASTDGFERTSDGRFEWDGDGDAATVTIRHDVDESFRPEAVDEQYVGGDGDWAIVARPQTSTSWQFYGADPGVEYSTVVDGEGRAGERLAYLGPHELHQTTASGERISLVVPEAADLASSPAEILDSVGHASERLRVGNRNDEVLLVTAPSNGVDWSPPGLSLTSDARVVDDARVDDPINVWVHEYVHTRQYRDHFDPNDQAVADDVRWFVEGSADYYAARTSLEQGHVDFDTFREVLARGTGGPAADAVLADPSTWSDDADYRKGALVAGAIDHRLRVDSDGEHTLQDVFRVWNRADTFTASDLEDATAEYGDESTREFVREYTRTEATPEPWGREVHREYFETDVAQFDYAVVSEPPVELSGPYRTGELGGSAVTGESVTAEVEVRNVGDVAGGYRAVLSVGGHPGDTATGRLVPGETETVHLRYHLTRTGSHTLVVGDYSQRLEVREPATPHVSEFSVASSRPVVGDGVAVTATVTNPEHRPASGDVAVRVGGEVVDSTAVDLAPGAETTVELTATFDRPGEHEVAVGDATLTVDAREPTLADRLPGFGAVTAIAAVLLVAALLARRS